MRANKAGTGDFAQKTVVVLGCVAGLLLIMVIGLGAGLGAGGGGRGGRWWWFIRWGGMGWDGLVGRGGRSAGGGRQGRRGGEWEWGFSLSDG